MTVAARPLTVLPDMLRLTIELLRSRPEVTALVDTDRIRSISPPDVSSPWVRVSRIGGTPALVPVEPRHFDAASMQLDCFAPPGQDVAVMTLARTVSAALEAGPGFRNDEGVVVDIEPSIGLKNEYDSSRIPPFPRVYFGLIVTARPA